MGKSRVNYHFAYTASSKPELLNYLKKQDTTVPSRMRRQKEHCERWAMFRLLATWATANRLSYPLRLLHRNKPDFLLCYGEREVGIECTEAVSQEYAESDALAERMGAQPLFFMDQFRRETPKRSAKERRQLIEEQPYGAGFADDEPEREWALCIMDCVHAKKNAFGKPDFRKYHKNWLLVYDNLPLPDVEIKTAVRFLVDNLKAYWIQNNRYDGILIDTGIQLVEVHSTELNFRPIVDLWAAPS